MATKSTKIIQPYEGFQEKFVRSNLDFVIGGGAMSAGKMHPLTTRILTPDGWKKLGKLKVGDYVCTPFGKPAKVTEIFEHKNKPIYTFHTKDGRITHCGLEHLWLYRTKEQIHKYRLNPTIDGDCKIDELSSLMEDMKHTKVYIPIPNAIEFEEKKFVIPPYAYGVLLCGGIIDDEKGFVLELFNERVIEKFINSINATKDDVIVDGFKTIIKSDKCKEYKQYYIDNDLYDKPRITSEYLHCSIEQRMELLNAIMDCNGTLESNNNHIASVPNRYVAINLVYICRSLGMVARRRHTNKDMQVCNVFVRTQQCLFSNEDVISQFLENKVAHNIMCFDDHVRVSSVTFKGNADARCIVIDDPYHLYIVDDFIVTHNTSAATLCVAEPCLDKNFRAVFLRNNLGDLKSGGGILDEFRKMYGNYCSVIESGDPHVDFPSGARVDVTHIADQSKDKVLQRFKGRQYDFIYFDEGTGFTWECFTAVYSRNRGIANWTGKVRMTTNPKKSHWIRTFIDWYVGSDGYIVKERNGVIRYFFINGETVKDVVWGDSKEEVYNKCRITIDRLVKRMNLSGGNITYKDIIKSFTFYEGKMSENKAIIGTNSGYAGSVAVLGGREAEANLGGNWNVDTDEEYDAIITNDMARSVFLNDECRNGDKWITCDLADTGTDNFLALVWDGFHIIDIVIKGKTTPRQNADTLLDLATKHSISNSHIIYDGVRGTYINDYIPEAIAFISNRTSIGMYSRMFANLKSECYMRLVNAIKNSMISVEDEISKSIYEHQQLNTSIMIETEFIEECSVVRFKEGLNGKMSLLSKKEMNAKLGKNRSMDLLDPIAMRFYPVLNLPYGTELVDTIVSGHKYSVEGAGVNIYDANLWGA